MKWQPTHVLAWEIPWTEEPGGLQSQRVGHDLATEQQQQTSKANTRINRLVWHTVGTRYSEWSVC